MAIKILSVKAPTKTFKNFTYSDIKLDLEYQFTKNNQLLKKDEIKDLKALYDLGAIKSSLFNLFNTFPGQKLLNPDFGIGLSRYLFEPISMNVAESIGQEIRRGIGIYEIDRVSIESLKVIPDEENQQYFILLTITAPRMKIAGITIPGTLSNSGFIFN
jgi:phage baseplate assembly protein W